MVTLLSQTTNYAGQALACLNGPGGEYKLVRDIAAQTRIPPSYLAKIVGMLRKRGLIQSRRGVSGGARLSRDPRTISLLDICRATLDPLLDAECLFCLNDCGGKKLCPGHKEWVRFQKHMFEMLNGVTLRALARGKSRAA